MADNKNDSNVKMPTDNGEVSVKLPDYAYESTQKKIYETLDKAFGENVKARKAAEKLNKTTADYHKKQDKKKADTDKFRNEQLELLKDLNESSKLGGAVWSAAGGLLKTFRKALWTATVTITGAGLAFTGMVARNTMVLGEMEAELTRFGTGFEEAGTSALDAIAGLQRVGLESEEAAKILRDYSGVIQGFDKKQFVELNKEFARLTDYGTSFGLTMKESAEVLAQDLETRLQLGILDQIETNQAAKRSQELYALQLNATRILGKSIDDIRADAEQSLATNEQVQLSILRVADGNQSLADQMQISAKKTATVLSGLEVDPDIANQLLYEAFSSVPFATEAGSQMYETLYSVLGQGSQDILEGVQGMSAAFNSGDPKRIQAAMDDLEEMPRVLSEAADKIPAEQLEFIQNKLLNSGNQFDKTLALMIGTLRTGNDNIDKIYDDLEVPPFTQALIGFQNALSKAKGNIGALFSDLGDDLAPYLNSFVEVFTDGTEDVPSVLDTLTNSIENVRDTFQILFGATEKTSKALGESLGKNLNTAIEDSAEWLKKFMHDLKFTGRGFYETQTGLGGFVTGIREQYNEFKATHGSLTDYFNNTIKPAFVGIWESIKVFSQNLRENGVMETIVSPIMDKIGNAIVVAFASGAFISIVASGIASLFGSLAGFIVGKIKGLFTGKSLFKSLSTLASFSPWGRAASLAIKGATLAGGALFGASLLNSDTPRDDSDSTPSSTRYRGPRRDSIEVPEPSITQSRKAPTLANDYYQDLQSLYSVSKTPKNSQPMSPTPDSTNETLVSILSQIATNTNVNNSLMRKLADKIESQ